MSKIRLLILPFALPVLFIGFVMGEIGERKFNGISEKKEKE